MRSYFLLFLLFFCFNRALAQSERTSYQRQEMIDSLKQVYYQGNEKNLEVLEDIVQNDPNPDSMLKYGKILLDKSVQDSNDMMSFAAHLHLGNGQSLKGELAKALEIYFEGMKYADKMGYAEGKGKLYVAIANTYSASDNSQNAVSYYQKSIAILRSGKDSLGLASAIFNVGDEYFNMGKFDSALYYTKEAKKIFERINYPIGDAYCFGNIGMIAAEKGDKIAAEENINEAVRILEKFQEYSAISVYLRFMSSIFLENGDSQTALEYAERSLNLANQYNLKDEISESNLTLSKIHEQLGNTGIAFDYYKNYVVYRDSVKNISAVQEMANLRTDYEVSQKQVEVDLLEKESTIIALQSKRQQFLLFGALALLVSLGLIAFLTFKRYRFERETKKIIEAEKNRSEQLLLNILPTEIAEELKNEGKVNAHRFNSVTVLFTDFKSFTSLAENISAERLVESIDFYFKKFDEITSQFGLEKIKTIGDSYMCAGGIPVKTDDHAKSVVKAAKAMMEFTNLPKPEYIEQFEMRIGIHTGPIVAGIVGIKKWQYDIWGDTVNIASRMESNSIEGRINLSEVTYQLIKDEFDCEYRGSIDVKNRGDWKMYFLS